MTDKELEIVIKEHEMQTLELKESFGVECIETACAFANAHGGYIIIGVDNTGNPTKTQLRTEALRDYENRIATATEPSVAVDSEKTVFCNTQVIVLKVLENPLKPVAYKGRSFIRKGSVNHQMTPSEIAECHLKSTGASMDAVIMPGVTRDDLDMDAVRRYMKKAVKEKRRNFSNDDDPWDILKKLEWVKSETEITRAAYLLFAKEPQIKFPQAIIHAGAFKDDGCYILDSRDIDGNIQDQVDETLVFIKRNIRQSIVVSAKAEHDRFWEYPIEALRETITNAICHRDYGSPHDIQIKILADRLIVYSPGQLPFDMSMEMLMTENHPSRPRNKLIAQAFYDIHLIEHYGSGMKRIKQECDQNGNDFPIMQNEMGTFSTTYLPRKADDTINAINDTTKHDVDTTKHDSDPIKQGGEPVNEHVNSADDPIKAENDPIEAENDPIKAENDPIKAENDSVKTDLKERIYSIIESFPGINRTKIAQEVGKSVETVKRNLAKLKSPISRIEYRGSKKTGGYYAIQPQDKP